MGDELTLDKDTQRVVYNLTSIFEKLTANLPRPQRNAEGPNRTYRLQTEFAYLINEITRGSRGTRQHDITQANDFLDRLMQATNQEKKS